MAEHLQTVVKAGHCLLEARESLLRTAGVVAFQMVVTGDRCLVATAVDVDQQEAAQETGDQS